jgi:hypothetical protein
MLAKMRLSAGEFDITERGDGLVFVRRGIKAGVFTLNNNKSYLVTEIVLRNPTLGESDGSSEYERSKSVVAETYSNGLRGPEFRGNGTDLKVTDLGGETYEAFAQAREGEPADLLLTVVVSSAVTIYLEKRPPQTTKPRPKVGVLGL